MNKPKIEDYLDDVSSYVKALKEYHTEVDGDYRQAYAKPILFNKEEFDKRVAEVIKELKDNGKF